MSERCIDKQLKFMVLLTLRDPDYRQGLTLDNLAANLSENKPLWFETNGKDDFAAWRKRLDRVLSNLHGKDQAIGKKDGVRVFTWAEGASDSMLLSLTTQLEEDLLLEIDFREEGDYAQMKEGDTPAYQLLYSSLNGKGGEVKRLILTTDQQDELARLSLQQ